MRASHWPVVGALAALSVAAVLGAAVVLSDGVELGAGITGYLLAAVLATALVQAHRAGRNRASASPWYNPRPRLDRLAAAALVGGLAIGAGHAFVVATELAK